MSRSFPLYPRITLTKRLDYFFSGAAYGSYSRNDSAGLLGPVQGNVQAGVGPAYAEAAFLGSLVLRR